MNLPVRETERKDLVQYVSILGRMTKRLFDPDESDEKPIESMLKPVHEDRYGFVYANDVASGQMEVEKPLFPEGSIIVRESKVRADSPSAEKVIAMVKHARGFSKETGDWEFLSFDGDLNLLARATKSDCATCHRRAESTDRVFRGYRP